MPVADLLPVKGIRGALEAGPWNSLRYWISWRSWSSPGARGSPGATSRPLWQARGRFWTCLRNHAAIALRYMPAIEQSSILTLSSIHDGMLENEQFSMQKALLESSNVLASTQIYRLGIIAMFI